MSFSIKDIQIFIPTYNREKYLKQSLQSLINQTAGIADITVFNNGCTDGTSEMIAKFAKYGVKEHLSKGTLLDCMSEAESMITSKYVMFFHDDDILNPKYLEYALEALNTYPDIAYITTKIKNFNDNKKLVVKSASKKHYYFTTQKDLANYLYMVEGVAMQTAIYNSKLFKSIPRKDNLYGKFFDWPYLVELAGHGNVVLFSDLEMFYSRVHSKQWSWNSSDWGISIENIINWDKCFYDAIHPVKKYSLEFFTFYSKFVLLLKGKYRAFTNRELKKEYSFEDLKKQAYKEISANLLYDFYDYDKLREILKDYVSGKFLNLDFSKMNEDYEENERDILFMLLMGCMKNAPKTKNNIPDSVEDWQKYLKRNKIVKKLYEKLDKYKGKKILLYGMGMVTQALLKEDPEITNYFCGVSDQSITAFEENGEYSIPEVPPLDIDDFGADVVFVTVYRFNIIKNYLKELGIKCKLEKVL